ncbi:MAG: hypothetical protein ACODAC_12135 [Pseudomonadota bacterium]
MNRILLLALVGGAVYWLSRGREREPVAQQTRSLAGTRAPDVAPGPTVEQQALLDEALEETFPASDSLAVTPPPRSGIARH